MSALADTSVLIDHLRGVDAARDLLRGQRKADALARRFGRSHSGIDAVDYCVAASARVHGLELWTLNVRHFPMLSDLQPPW